MHVQELSLVRELRVAKLEQERSLYIPGFLHSYTIATCVFLPSSQAVYCDLSLVPTTTVTIHHVLSCLATAHSTSSVLRP